MRLAFSESGSPKKSVKYFGTPRREAASKNCEIISPFESLREDSDGQLCHQQTDEDLFIKDDSTDFYQVEIFFLCWHS